MFEGNHFYEEWSVNGDEASFVNSQWYEPITASGFNTTFAPPDGVREGVRYWGAPGVSESVRNNAYTDCFARDINGSVSLRPTVKSNIIEETSAIDTDNTETAVATDNCDYSDSDDFDGWGFDPVSMTSCPPLANDDSGSNVVITDTDGDGAITGATDELPDDSTGNSNDAATENDSTAVEDEDVASNIQGGTTSVSEESSDETTPQSGGGSVWLPILMFVLAFRRPICALQMKY